MNQTLDKIQIQNFRKLVQTPLLESGEKKAVQELIEPDWGMLYRLARKHNVVNLGYEAVMMLPAEQRPGEELLKQWQMNRDQCTLQCIYQQAALEEIIQAFEENQIPFVLLKGAVIRELYPRADLRSMSDLDILIREDDAKRAKNVVNALGYQDHSVDSRNEDVYMRDIVTIELHRELFWKNDIWNAHFSEVWNVAERKEGYSYYFEMRSEDFYFYILGHMIHHMQHCGGIGIKAFFDSWIYSMNYGNKWDENYLEAVLKELGLYNFYLKLQELLECWFSGKGETSLSKEWTEFIVYSGAYGNFDNFVVTNPALNSTNGSWGRTAMLLYLWKRLFPDYKEMCNMFPRAKRGRFLYPYYAVKRIIRNGILRYSAVKREVKSVKKMDSTQIQNLRDLYNELGIDEILENE